tara:strand:- start:183 stop:347 length:165 start_codon:yes stop_codon:yes gene_type:complete
MAEWFKAHAWKACIGATLSWVRIPFSPPIIESKTAFFCTKIKNRKKNKKTANKG